MEEPLPSKHWHQMLSDACVYKQERFFLPFRKGENLEILIMMTVFRNHVDLQNECGDDLNSWRGENFHVSLRLIPQISILCK